MHTDMGVNVKGYRDEYKCKWIPRVPGFKRVRGLKVY